MKKYQLRKAVFLVILLISSFSVLGAPPPVATWWGRVTIDSTQYNDTAIVDAYIGDIIVADVLVAEFTADYYHIDVPCTQGDSVGFKIYGVQVAQSNQICDQGTRTELNLSIDKLASGSTCTYSAACSGGYCCSGATQYNGDGTGTCQASICVAGGDDTTPSSSRCRSSWDCTAWSPCANGKQTRTCNDLHYCKIPRNIPPTEQNCTIEDGDDNIIVTPITPIEEAKPLGEGAYIGEIKIYNNANWKWSGTEWVKEGTPGYDDIVIEREPLFGNLDKLWLYVFIGLVIVAIIILLVEMKRNKDIKF